MTGAMPLSSGVAGCRWRASTSSAARCRLELPGRAIFIDEIEFEDLGRERAKQLSAIDTRFVLPRDQVDLAIAAGRDALRTNEQFQQFSGSLRGRPSRSRAAGVGAGRRCAQ